MAEQKKTKNEKNQFLYDYFEKELQKAQLINNQNIKFCMQKILKSLRLYPLPITSVFQASMLEGVGEKSLIKIAKLIKMNYGQFFINEDQNMQTQQSQTQLSQSQLSQSGQSSNKIMHYDDQNDITQIKSKTKHKYEMNSNSWAILICLYYNQQFNQKSYSSQKDIKKTCQEINLNFKIQITSFVIIKSFLKKAIVDQLQFGDEIKYCLTEEGYNEAQKLYNHRQAILEHDQCQSQTYDSFSQVSKEKNSKKKKQQMKFSVVQEVQSDDELSHKKNKAIEQQRTLSLKKFPQLTIEKNIINKENIEYYNIILVIDNREIYKENQEVQRQFIKNTLKNKYDIQDCNIGQLPIGDFLWVIKIKEKNKEAQIYALDYIIERKTMDDLASSIIDKRYKDQKIRLKNTGISNVFYLIEGQKLTQSQTIQNSTIESAIMSIRMNQQFKIKQTNNLQDSIDFLANLHLVISKQFKKKYDLQEKFSFEFTLDEFLQKNTKSLNHTVQKTFGNMLKSVKQCSQENTQNLLEYFSTPYNMITQLTNIDTYEQKIQFFKTNLPQIKNKVLVQSLITLFSFKKFPNIMDF